jgi:predicted Zn-dependent protease with MMP-like domain
MDFGSQRSPSMDEVEALAQRAWAQLPAPFRALTGDVVVRVENYADDSLLDELEIDDPLELTGLYSGAGLQDAANTPSGQLPAMVFLFRMPILFEWAERGDVTLEALIAHVLVHEIGHHFGLSDADMDAIPDEGT